MISRLKKLLRNVYFDLRFSGRFLGGNKATPYSERGAYNTVNTDYDILPFLFGKVDIAPADTLIDVGCGKGRVIVYWLSRGLRNRLVGVELDEDVAAATKAQFRRSTNVDILCGDVNEIELGGEDHTREVYYLYNPFDRNVMERFEAKLGERAKRRDLVVIYHRCEYVDVFAGSGRWDVEKAGFVHASGYRSDSAIIRRPKVH